MTYISKSEEETQEIGKNIGAAAAPGEIYSLYGEMGAGKTAFTKGFAKGLGITDDVTSPTFTIINEYSGKHRLYHFDAYRIVNPDEMLETGCEDYFYSDGVCVIEWAELIQEIIPERAVKITIAKQGENIREITVTR